MNAMCDDVVASVAGDDGYAVQINKLPRRVEFLSK
jgi:hypothetical protein